MGNPSLEWDNYWSTQKKAVVYSFFANIYRFFFQAIPLRLAFEKYFPKEGTFLEAGSGSAADAIFIKKQQRKLIALDYSKEALRLAKRQKKIDDVLLGDLLNLSLESGTFDGIWNLGVMEHFSKDEIDRIFGHFHRILKDRGRIILLWPARWNFINNIAPYLFPAMPSILSSKKEASEILKRNRFTPLSVASTIAGDYVIVGQKES